MLAAPAKPDAGAPVEPEEPGALAAIGALLLIGALIAAVVWSAQNTSVRYRYRAVAAYRLLLDGDYRQAAQQYEQLLPLYGAADARLGLSYAYLARRDGTRALTQVRAALDTAPPDLKPACYTQLGRVLAFSGNDAEAFAAWKSAEGAALPYAGSPAVEVAARSALWQSAMLHWRRGEFAEAQPVLEDLSGVSDLYGTSASARLAQLLAPTDPSAARRFATMALATRDDTGVSFYLPHLRVPGLEEGLPPEAVGEMVRQLRGAEQQGLYGTGNVQPSRWGRFYAGAGEPYLAIRYLERDLASNHASYEDNTFLAVALIETGQDADALPHLLEAERIDPGAALSHRVLARLYVGRKEWKEAAAQLTILKKIEPDSVSLHLQLAEYYVGLGAYDLAEDEYLTAVEKQSGGASGADASLALARYYTDVRGAGCAKGLPAAQDSLRQHPDSPMSLDATGWALVQCKSGKDALPSLERAVSLAPGEPRYSYHLGKAYALLGRDLDARELFNRTINLDPGGPWERLAVAELPALQPEP